MTKFHIHTKHNEIKLYIQVYVLYIYFICLKAILQWNTVLGMKKTFKAVKNLFPSHVRGRRHRSEIILNCLVAHKFGYIRVWCVFNLVILCAIKSYLCSLLHFFQTLFARANTQEATLDMRAEI